MKNNLNRFHHQLSWTMGLLGLLAVTFLVYAWSEKRIDQANDMRHQAFLLAAELRQSSDDLTHMTHTYVITGDVR